MIVLVGIHTSLGGLVKTAQRKFCPLGRNSADFDSSVFLDGDWITGFDRLKEIVSEQVDGDDASVIPDVIHQQSCIRDRVDVLREQHRLGPQAQTPPHPSTRPRPERNPRSRCGTDDRAAQIFLVKLLVVRIGAGSSVLGIAAKQVLDVGTGRVERLF